ncbi:flavodoxin [Anaerotignum neopropionicum]|uniref:Flavodoxin n=1 Tax=Anaerotignum neopropionicum TaxID=36847 RepID=A0A136WIZ0_9FIRM|nr:flavodoxin domain-containing protein [Anaerotignum neopropionicum]KXL54194.1 flavodoxin [Anaerotignum neopropionicum]KXL54319.1 flavodoxin [Anaerotignum neopropionicum]
MAKTAVIFRSEYGSTKRYATYIGEKLQADIFTTEEAKDISSYETIVFGGGIYASGLNGSDWLKKNQEALLHKKLILFTCGISDPQDEKNVENILNGVKKSLGEELMSHAKIFFFRGAMDYKRLKLTHKGMMKVLYEMIKRKKERTTEEEGILQTQKTPMDFVDVSQGEALISYVKE